MNIENRSEAIRRYLHNLMTEEERADFEQELKKSPDLVDELEFTRDLQFVSKHKSVFQTKAMIGDLMTEINPQPDFKQYKNLLSDDTPTSPWRRWLIGGLIVGILTAAGGYYFYAQKQAKELSARYLQTLPLERIMYFDSTDMNPLAQITHLYDKNLLDSMLVLFDEYQNMPKIKDDTTAHLYKAIGLLRTQKSAEATKILRGVSQNSSEPIRQVAQRYLALALLAQGEIAEARKYLEALTNDPVFGEKAKAILLELN